MRLVTRAVRLQLTALVNPDLAEARYHAAKQTQPKSRLGAVDVTVIFAQGPLEGMVEAKLGNLANLQELGPGKNPLSGTDPSSLSNLQLTPGILSQVIMFFTSEEVSLCAQYGAEAQPSGTGHRLSQPAANPPLPRQTEASAAIGSSAR